MFRSSPPSGRARRLLTVATLLCSVALATPALGQVPTETPSEPVVVTVPPTVTGLDPLILTVVGEDPVLTVTDAAGGVGAWTLESSEGASGEYAVDLNAPDEGVSPVNGDASVTLTVAGVTVLTATVRLDRDPTAPVLTAAGAAEGTALSWEPAAGPGTVTYRVERESGSTWGVVVDGLDATSYRDEGIAPGSYRYRLTAAVAGADGGLNRSAPSVALARIAPPAPSPSDPESVTETPSPLPSPASAPDFTPPPANRVVAVTGEIRGGIDERRRPRQPGPRHEVANRPAMMTAVRLPPEALEPRIAAPAPVPAPAAAAPRPTVSVPRPRQVPIPVGPGGRLAVASASGRGGLRLEDLRPLLAIGLLGAMATLARRRRAGQPGAGRSPVNT